MEIRGTQSWLSLGQKKQHPPTLMPGNCLAEVFSPKSRGGCKQSSIRGASCLEDKSMTPVGETLFSSVPPSNSLVSILKGAVSAQKAFHGFETEMRELLGGTEEFHRQVDMFNLSGPSNI